MRGSRVKQLRREFKRLHGRPPETTQTVNGAYSEFRRFKRQRTRRAA